ncbi:MAG: Ig-like domain-containing protein [Verrucomicrobia bacterium]|nr:Ig-like domain-containing protein [Verrucomicrobiota bacterium]
MNKLTKTACSVTLLCFPALRTLTRTLTPALLLAAILPLSSPAQTLPVTNGLQLWLKADAGISTNSSGVVTTWADQSGSGNDATATDPTKAPTFQLNALNGKPTLRFGGDTRYLDVANSASISDLANDVTILTLVKYDDVTGGYRCCLGKSVGNGPAPFDWWNNAGASGGRTYFWLGNGTPSSYTSFISLVPPPVGVYNVMGFSWGNGIVDQYLNDVSNGHFTYTITPADGGGPLRIGSRPDLVTQLKGNLAEVLIYQPALSDADRTAVIGYLSTKYALAFNLPPTASIQTPTNGSTVAAHTDLSVSINASDPDGTVARVDLLNHGGPVASWTQPPYTVSLTMLNPGNAVLTAVAVDNLGRAATSAPVSLTVTGAALATPISSGLKVWLRADAGVTTNANGLVTNWADQSGNGNDAVQADTTAAPLLAANVINGLPALSFGSNAFSVNQFLEISDAGTAFTASNFTTFVQARFTDFASYRTLWCKTSGGWAAPVDWWFRGTVNAYRGDGITIQGVGSIQPALAGQFGTFGLAATGPTLTHYLGFADNGTGNTTTTPASAGNLLRIGRRDDGVVQMQGEITEILIYGQALSASDRSNVVSYLSSKYGVAQVVIGNQPPTVSIASPTNGATFPMSSTIPVLVSAADSDGVVRRVDVLANGALIASFTNSPYQVSIDLLTPGTVSLKAVAVDNWGAGTTSAPVVLTVTGSTPAMPATNDLRLWLSANVGVQTNSDGTLAGWNDRSGNANTALPSGSAPQLVPNALNGQPVVHFNEGNYLDVATAPSIQIAGDVSCYAVVLFEDFINYRSLLAKSVGAQPASLDYYVLPNSGIPRFYRGNGTGSLGSVDANRPLTAGTYMLVGFEMAGPTATHYLNGDIAELLIFGHGLSASERDQVFSYLGAKYSLGLVRLANLPPTVTILNPTNGTTMAVPTGFTVSAQAADSDSPISRVDFLANGTVMASVTKAPYSVPLQVITPGLVTLQAQAVDIWGAIGMSAPVVVTVTGQGPAAPPASGRVLWLKADKGITTNADGTVAAWSDQSGLANNALQADPTAAPMLLTDPATGRPVLQFDGTNSQYLDVTSAPSIVIEGDISSFCAFNLADVATAHTLWSKTVNGRAYPWVYSIAAGGGAVITRGNNDGVQGLASSGPVRTGSAAVAGVTVEGAFTSHYLNGQPNSTGVLGYGAGDQGGSLRIGALDNLAAQFAGTLSEVLLYNRALSGNDLLLANTYLAARSGIAVAQVPPPSLVITGPNAGLVQISWPAVFSGFVLESQTALGSGAWTPVVTNPPNNQVSIRTTNAPQFFRLRSQ